MAIVVTKGSNIIKPAMGCEMSQELKEHDCEVKLVGNQFCVQCKDSQRDEVSKTVKSIERSHFKNL